MNPRAQQFGAEEIDLTDVTFTKELLDCVPASLARRFQLLPVADLPKTLKVAMADPSNLEAIDALHRIVQQDLEVCVADADQLQEFVVRLYGLEDAD